MKQALPSLDTKKEGVEELLRQVGGSRTLLCKRRGNVCLPSLVLKTL